jgi:predicted HNH restriction endonuclease
MKKDYLYIDTCYQFAKQKGLDEASSKIRTMKFIWDRSYNTTAKRGYFLRLFNDYEYINEYLEKYWPFGKTRKGQLEISRMLRIANEYDAYLGNDTESFSFTFEELGLEANEVGDFFEGSRYASNSSRIERNSEARRKCLDHFGYDCQACGINLGKAYGSIGDNFIHVHHRIDLSLSNERHQINAIRDLIPLCPNCHAMIHRDKPAMTIEKLKRAIK